MATISEATLQAGSSDKAAGLIAAIGLISAEQTYTFDLYKRVVLPVDGYVFWIKYNQLPDYLVRYGTPALYGKTAFGSRALNQLNATNPYTPEELQRLTFSINGSLHLTQELHQEDSSTFVDQTIAFTTKTQVTYFESIAPDELYIVTIPNGSKVAFSRQQNRYTNAGLWHYHGRSVFSITSTQIIDDIADLNPNLQIVSNSLPYWLALSTNTVPVYPSFLSPKNLIPPFITADIRSTEALQQAPAYDRYTSQGQLVSDTIEFTMYGLNNDAALDFQYSVLSNSENGEYGIQNMPVPVDVKTNQTEFQVIAQKKTMMVQADYYQYRSRAFARTIIQKAMIQLTPEPHDFPVPIIV